MDSDTSVEEWPSTMDSDLDCAEVKSPTVLMTVTTDPPHHPEVESSMRRLAQSQRRSYQWPYIKECFQEVSSKKTLNQYRHPKEHNAVVPNMTSHSAIYQLNLSYFIPHSADYQSILLSFQNLVYPFLYTALLFLTTSRPCTYLYIYFMLKHVLTLLRLVICNTTIWLVDQNWLKTT